MQGLCCFFSETGTEGGYWAFQDNQFIKPNTTLLVCKKCGLWWDSAAHPDFVQEIILVDDSPKAIANLRASLKATGMSEEQMDRFLAQPTHCWVTEHRWELGLPDGEWAPEGLHILKNGDHLTILDKNNPSQQVWSGTIDLIQHPLFTQAASGMWIHADQRGVARDTWAPWFFYCYPAILVPKQ